MITTEQSDIVLDCAKVCSTAVEWPNEVAVYELVARNHADVFGAESLSVLKFCAEEVAHQQEGALAVSWFFNAWKHAMERKRDGYELNLATLNELAAIIEPVANEGGRFRSSSVTIRGMLAGTAPAYIERDMAGFEVEVLAYARGERTDAYGRDVTPAGLYEMFEVIHPRANGNGREGKIIYNWLLDQLGTPTFPPEPARFKH